MSQRVGDWICTSTGIQFWPMDPRPEEVEIEDIAHALSNVCRYGGHSKVFYSVAQHSVLACQWVIDLGLQDNGDTARWALLHDATEAYVGDMVSPLKRSIGQYRRIERNIQAAIMKRFGLQMDEPAIVKTADQVLLATEATALMPRWSVESWHLSERADPTVRIKPKSPADAKKEFLWQYEHLFGIRR